MTYQYIEKKLEELEKRIEALEQEPQEVGPMDKLISTRAVLDMWRQEICYGRTCHARDEGRCTETFCDFKLFEYKINHMPPVNPQEPKTGHWIEHTGWNNDSYGTEYSCNKCNEWVEDKSNFCPNCGTRMERSGNDSN